MDCLVVSDNMEKFHGRGHRGIKLGYYVQVLVHDISGIFLIPDHLSLSMLMISDYVLLFGLGYGRSSELGLHVGSDRYGIAHNI